MIFGGFNQIPIWNFAKTAETAKTISLRADFATDTEWVGNLSQQRQLGIFETIRAIYFNTMGCASDVVFSCPETGQSITLKHGKQGYRNVLISMGLHFKVVGVSPDVFLFNLLNVDMPQATWPDDTVTPGSVPISSLLFSTAPRLAGRTTAGAGAGEEIAVDATLTLAALVLARAAISGDVAVAAGSNTSVIGANKVTNAMLRQSAALSVIGRSANSVGDVADIVGTLGQVLQIAAGPIVAFGTPPVPGSNTVPLASLANAAAQYDIVGRKTAGGGAWEDSTRTQLNLPGLELSNTFTINQTITQTTSTFSNTDSTLVLSSTDAGASGPTITLWHNSASPAANDTIRQRAYFNDTAAAAFLGFQLAYTLTSATLGAESVGLRYGTRQAGAFSNRLLIDAGVYLSGSADQGAGSFTATTLYAANVLIADGSYIRLRSFTVATLPAPVVGGTAFVSDALAPAFGAAVVGGGAVGVPVYGNNTPAWFVG